MNAIAVTGIIILTAIIGAMPFGLVNLSVLDTAFHKNRHTALKVAHGESWIEVLYRILALLAGSIIAQVVENSPLVKYTTVLIPIFVGGFFLFKKGSQPHLPDTKQGYLKGVVLNLLSVQVLL